MELKVAKKKSVDAINVVVLSGDESVATLALMGEGINERVAEIVLFEIQRMNPDLEFYASGHSTHNFIAEFDSLEEVSIAQEGALDELRTKNEEQETRIEMLEKELEEARAANDDWAKKFKTMKLVEDAEALEEKPS